MFKQCFQFIVYSSRLWDRNRVWADEFFMIKMHALAIIISRHTEADYHRFLILITQLNCEFHATRFQGGSFTKRSAITHSSLVAQQGEKAPQAHSLIICIRQRRKNYLSICARRAANALKTLIIPPRVEAQKGNAHGKKFNSLFRHLPARSQTTSAARRRKFAIHRRRVWSLIRMRDEASRAKFSAALRFSRRRRRRRRAMDFFYGR